MFSNFRNFKNVNTFIAFLSVDSFIFVLQDEMQGRMEMEMKEVNSFAVKLFKKTVKWVKSTKFSPKVYIGPWTKFYGLELRIGPKATSWRDT